MPPVPRTRSRSATVELEAVERVVVVEAALDEAETLGEPVPHRLVERRAGVLLDGVVDDLAEVLGRTSRGGRTR